ncbi:MAG: hypothetical protein ACK4TA_06580 [Saprospiraceae bacterium]
MRSTLNRSIPFALLTLLAFSVASCEVVGDIFEAGVWSGVILVVGGILLLVFLFTRIFRGRR